MKKDNTKNTKILVSNLSKKISGEDLRKLFKEYGEITKITFHKANHTLAAISFIDEDSASRALIKNNTLFKSIQLKVEFYQEQKEVEQIENDSDMSDNEGCYDKFMSEFKEFYKDHKKTLKTNVNNMISDEVNVSEMLCKANNLYLSNNYDEAIQLSHEIIKASPNLQEPYQILSQIYEDRKDIRTALSFRMLAAQLSNGDKEIWIRCCNLNKQVKNYQQAEYCITRASKLEKNNVFILFEWGSINEQIGNLSKAARIYEKLLNFYPNIRILIQTAKIHEKLNKPLKEIMLIEKNYPKLEQKSQALILLYEIYLKNKEYERGIMTYNSIKDQKEYETTLANPNFDIKRLMCFLFIQESLNEEKMNLYNIKPSDNIIGEIVKHFSKIITTIDSTYYSLDNEVDNVHHLFYLLEDVNQIEKFIDIFGQIEKMLENTADEMKSYFNNINPEIYLKIAEHFAKRSQYEMAVDFFEKCLKIKDDDKVRLRLSEAYGLLGQNDKALSILQVGLNSNQKTENEEQEIYDGQMLNQCNNEPSLVQKDKENDDRTITNNNIDERDVSLSDLGNNNDDQNEGLYHLIKNQINDEFEEESNQEENDFIDMETIRKSSFNNNELYMPMNRAIEAPTFLSGDYLQSSSKKFLGKKRLKVSHKMKSKDRLIIDFNFDNFLHRKNRSKEINSNNNNADQDILDPKISNVPRNRSYSMTSIVSSLNSLKIEFDELASEVQGNKSLYLKIQESLFFLQSNNIDTFLSNTLEPLKKVLIQELKIEDYKTDLFNYVLEKSLIKNYFYKKTSIFDQNDNDDEEEEMTLTEALRPSNQRGMMNDKELEEDKNDFLEKKDNLFVRKTANKFILAKKKVGQTLILVQKQLDNLENIEKYIKPEKFFMIIEKFIEYGYERKKYKDVYMIITLLVNSSYFLQRNDNVSFNFILYAIMSSYQLKRYKTSFELSKRNISRYSLQDIPFFWMQLWNVEKKFSSNLARQYLYKIYLNKNVADNIYFQQILATCYFQNGNIDYANQLLIQVSQKNESPYIMFFLGISHMFQLLNRLIKIKKPNYLKALHYLDAYTIKRIRTNPLEVNYNLGRFFQFIGYDREALNKYEEVNEKIDHIINFPSSHDEKKKLKISCVYNMSMILKKGGNEEQAHKLIHDNIII